MELIVQRISENGESTIGALFINGKFECWTLEDEYRTHKVFNETRIPEGTYEIKLRTVGGHHLRYKELFKFHKGMLELQDVPNFKYILIHIGNEDDDTAGCLLVGDTANNNKLANGFIGNSGNAYKRLYPKVLKAIKDNEKVTITYKDLEK